MTEPLPTPEALRTAADRLVSALSAHADPEYRLAVLKRLVRRLDLGEFMHRAPMQETLYIPQQVTIPLRQHIGVPASPTVSVGERVSAGALIATVPDDALGAPVHASISGVVRLVDSAAITIEKE